MTDRYAMWEYGAPEDNEALAAGLYQGSLDRREQTCPLRGPVADWLREEFADGITDAEGDLATVAIDEAAE